MVINNGLIVNWGVTGNVANDKTIEATVSLSFSKTPFIGIAQRKHATADYTPSIYPYISTVTIINNSSNYCNHAIWYLVIGY